MRLATLFPAHSTTWRAACERRRLERDIDSFATSAERQDLFAALGRYPDSMTKEIRHMVDNELAREQFERRFGFTHLRAGSAAR